MSVAPEGPTLEGHSVRDIVYFRARWPELEADPSGTALVVELSPAIEARGFRVEPTRPRYDGCSFVAARGRLRHRIEVTPYFEAEPMEWSVQVAALGTLSTLFGRRERIELLRACADFLGAEPRIQGVRWMRLSDLATGKTDDESAEFSER